jgi:hypothetical protein
MYQPTTFQYSSAEEDSSEEEHGSENEQGGNEQGENEHGKDVGGANETEDDTTESDGTDEEENTTSTGNLQRNTQYQEDGRMQALDQWRRNALSWINGAGRTPVTEGPGSQDNGLGLHNSSLRFEEQRRANVIMVDSLDRDQRIYPLPTQCKLKLPRVYRNVYRIDIVQLKMMNGLYAISSFKGNATLTILENNIHEFEIVVPDGSYSASTLATQLTTLLNDPGNMYSYTVSFSTTTGLYTICGTGPFTILFSSSLPTSKQALYIEWGLGWNLGFGGVPTDIDATQVNDTTWCATASCMPRLFDDYIFLRLNDSENMNMVDHTDLENTAVIQDSTGQVSHYFGKLMLHQFGCYSQTFVEAPKYFQPILGRLERLSFEWVDRHGAVLAGPDACSCEWNMTVRILEVHDRPVDTSSLIHSLPTPGIDPRS